MELMSALAAVGAGVGGYYLWRRFRDWEPSGDRPGEVIARTGIEATEKVSDFAADAVKFTGELTSKTVGTSVNAIDDVVSKVMPGHRHQEEPSKELKPTPPKTRKPSPKKPAKPAAKKSGKTTKATTSS